MLHGKKILLGITGSIAAYKAAFLVRLLVKNGAEVKVVMSDDAQNFITPLTLSTLSKNPVYSSFVLNNEGEWTNHVELGLWADVMLIAPATANTLAKMANGICDNLLLAAYLSARCKVLLAPAMDLDMYAHPATQKNLQQLASFGNIVLPVGNGELASGLSGNGRMMEPEDMVVYLGGFFNTSLSLKGKRVMVTAGPTYENLDPVRFIGNHSTGKMGFAIAEEFAARGAEVTLIAGPGNLTTNVSNINRINVISAADMFREAVPCFANCDIAVMSAAVADYTPAVVSDSKIKKKEEEFNITLTKTKDILAELGKMKKNGQVLVGFALETDNEEENAKKKLESKKLDFIVLNSLRDAGAGFGHDTNKISIIDKTGVTSFGIKTKKEVAADIVNKITEHIHA